MRYALVFLLLLLTSPTWADQFSGKVTGLNPLTVLAEDGKTKQTFTLKSGVTVPDWVKVGSKVTVDYTVLSVMSAGPGGTRQCSSFNMAERVRTFSARSAVDPLSTVSCQLSTRAMR